jgi:hypothetical protein
MVEACRWSRQEISLNKMRNKNTRLRSNSLISGGAWFCSKIICPNGTFSKKKSLRLSTLVKHFFNLFAMICWWLDNFYNPMAPLGVVLFPS